MRNISDIIEKFILEVLGGEDRLELSRNELAAYFECAPSQINYVLQTRFTPERGFVIDSRRGIGGFITVAKLSQTPQEAYGMMVETDEDGISHQKAVQIIDKLLSDGLLTVRESAIIRAVVSDKALISPATVKERLRKSIIKAILIELIKDSDKE